MKIILSHLCFLLLAFCSISLAAEETEIPSQEATTVVTPPAVTEIKETNEIKEEIQKETTEVKNEEVTIKEIPSWLAMALAFDVGFTAGTPSQQGFSIPFFRLNASGDITPWVSYSIKLGQTREVSSSMLPQLLPTEVKVNLSTLEKKMRKLDSQGNFGADVGMFIPTFNPFWSKDLNEMEIPAYSTAQAVIFLPQDIGVEFFYEKPLQDFKATLGVFNGSGNFSLNTNNSRAVIASLSKGISLGSSRVTLGTSGYLLNQSSDGTLNYKSYQLIHAYLNLQTWQDRFLFGVEYSTGNFNDSSQRTRSTEFAFVTEATLSESVSLFGRYEKMEAAPKGDYDDFAHLQVGPVIKIVPQAKLFIYWDYHYYQGPSLSAYYAKLRVSL